MRLYTRTLVTYSSEPGHTDELVPDLATDLGHAVEGRPELDVHPARGRAVRERAADHLPRRQVRHRAVLRLRRHRRRPHLRGRPARRPRQPLRRARTRTRRRTSWACRRSRPRTTATIVFRLRAPQPDLPFVMALPSSSPVPIEADTGADYGSDPVSSGPYAITSVDPATGILLDRNPQWDPATDDVRTALPDKVVVRTGLTGVERDQALLAGSADLDITGTGVQAATTSRLAGGRGRPAARPGRRRHHRRRPPARPADGRRARWTTRTAGRRWPRSSTAAAVQTALGGAGNVVRRSQLWPRALPGGPEDGDPRPDLDAARAHLEACGQPDGFSTVARRRRHAAPGVDRRRARSPASWPRSASRPRCARCDAGDVLRRPTSAARTTSPANGFGIVLATWTADFPTAGLLPRAARRRAQHPHRRATPTTRGSNDPAVNGLIDQATRRRAARTPGGRWPTTVGAGRRSTCRWPRPASSSSPASGCATAWYAAVQRLRRRHRRRSMSVG